MISWIVLLAFAFLGYRMLGIGGAILGAVLGTAGYKVSKLLWLRSQFKKHPQDFPEFLAPRDPTQHLREQAPTVVRRKILVRVDFLESAYDAWGSEMRWGQWAWPAFERSEAERLASDLRAHGIDIRYDSARDVFEIYNKGQKPPFPIWGHATEVGTLFGIGAGEWQWRELTD